MIRAYVARLQNRSAYSKDPPAIDINVGNSKGEAWERLDEHPELELVSAFMTPAQHPSDSDLWVLVRVLDLELFDVKMYFCAGCNEPYVNAPANCTKCRCTTMKRVRVREVGTW